MPHLKDFSANIWLSFGQKWQKTDYFQEFLLKELFIYAFLAKMWAQVGSKMEKRLFSYQLHYYQPSISKKQVLKQP